LTALQDRTIDHVLSERFFHVINDGSADETLDLDRDATPRHFSGDKLFSAEVYYSNPSCPIATGTDRP